MDEPKPIPDIFSAHQPNKLLLERISAKKPPRIRYILAFTPRSGSSFLSDILRLSKKLGVPTEAISAGAIEKILHRIPGYTPDQYLENFFKAQRTGPVSGLKASWFQFKNFTDVLQTRDPLQGCRYIYLTRRNLTAQAVSLYKATESGLFHTNVEQSADILKKLIDLDYDFKKIQNWKLHIQNQEIGWQSYFKANKIFPLCITYEEIETDVTAVLDRIADFLGVALTGEPLVGNSIFNRVSDIRNVAWTLRFDQESYEAQKNQHSTVIGYSKISTLPLGRRFLRSLSRICRFPIKAYRSRQKPFKVLRSIDPLPYNPTLSAAQVVQLVLTHIHYATPFSLIRLGDGEASVLGFPDFVGKAQFEKFERIFFGKNRLTRADRNLLVRELRESVKSADVIGVHGGNEVTPFTVARAFLHHYALVSGGARFCFANVHRKLQEENLYEKILSNLPVLGIISCRDISEKIQQRFGIQKVIFYEVPEEAHHAEFSDRVARHFPQRYEELRANLKVETPGMVFLIGAGPCGKIYCRWIKERGGIALDIGSVFDGWSGKRTRSYMGSSTVESSYTITPSTEP